MANSPWPKSGHDLNNTGQSQYTGPQTNATKWNYTANGSISSSPVIGSDGTIYFGSWDGHLYALNPNGTQKWNYTAGSIISVSPAIASDGTIYFGSWDNKTYALGSNGVQKWNYTAKGQILSSITLGSDGTIYFGDADKNLYALNPNGTLKWNFTTGNITFSSPAIGSDGTIYFGSDDHNLYALNSNGTLKWNYTTGSYVSSSPAIGSDGTIYFGGEDNNAYALNPNGTLKWKFTTGDKIEYSPTIGNDGTIYIESYDGNLYALNQDGTKKWNYSTGGAMESSPVIGNDGTIYFGSCNGNFYALNPNGTLKWGYVIENCIDMSPAIGSDGTLYFGSNAYFGGFINLYALHDNVLVNSVDPVGNAVNVPAGKVIKITFNNPIKMGSGQIELKNSSGNALSFTTNISGSTLAITPTTSLSSDKYTLTLYNDCVTDLDGNHLELYSTSFTVDATPPNVSANQTGGIFNSIIKVTLSSESDATICYRINGGLWNTFTGSGTVSITNEGINNLEFYAVDAAGNPSQHITYIYTIDKTPPVVTVTPSNVSLSKDSINVDISSEPDSTIYYRLNGGSWSTFTGSGTVVVKTEGITNLEVYAVDAAGNPSDHTMHSYVIDKTAPEVDANPGNSLSNGSINVSFLSESDATIYYRLNGGPWKTFIGSGVVVLSTEGIANMEFYAVDAAGNPSQHTVHSYVIDKTAPVVYASPAKCLSNSNINVSLFSESDAAIYYRLNGGSWNNFTCSGTVVISDVGTTNLEFYAVDAAGNPSMHKTCIYTIDKTAPKVTITNPKNRAVGVSRTATIKIKFSENIKASTKWSKIYIKNLKTGKIVSIRKSISGNTFYIKMNSKRYAHNWYQVYIPASAVKNSAGNNLTAGCKFSFKTGRY